MRKSRLTAILLAVVLAAAAFPVSSRAYPDKPVQDYNPLGVKLTVKNIRRHGITEQRLLRLME